MRRTLKKITCGILAAVSMFGCAATLTACETTYPEVQMKIEFNGETYTLEYKLYRELAPQTVKHFLWLANDGYYNNLCVHDYSQNDYLRMYTGAYSVAESEDDADGLVYKKYYETIQNSKNFSSFPVSVWMQKDQSNPTYTLKGEFEDNNFRVESGDLKETFGSLTMYYYDISEEEAIAESDVYMKRADGKAPSKCDYKYNYTTSMFYISLSNNAVNNKAYCTFATIKGDSKSKLEDLKEALDEYIEDKYDGEVSEFTESELVMIGEDDPMLKTQAVRKTFSVPKQPIVIKSVKILKY